MWNHIFQCRCASILGKTWHWFWLQILFRRSRRRLSWRLDLCICQQEYVFLIWIPIFLLFHFVKGRSRRQNFDARHCRIEMFWRARFVMIDLQHHFVFLYRRGCLVLLHKSAISWFVALFSPFLGGQILIGHYHIHFWLNLIILRRGLFYEWLQNRFVFLELFDKADLGCWFAAILFLMIFSLRFWQFNWFFGLWRCSQYFWH